MFPVMRTDVFGVFLPLDEEPAMSNQPAFQPTSKKHSKGDFLRCERKETTNIEV
jgi:hypothetical protein